MGQARGGEPKIYWLLFKRRRLQTSALQRRDLRALVLISRSRSSINSAASFWHANRRAAANKFK